jgi:hypothetical protein
MKNTLFAFLLVVLASSNLDACVTYNPSNQTYTVDPSGSFKPKKKIPKKVKNYTKRG